MVARTFNLSKELGKNSSGLLFGARGVGKTRLCKEFLVSAALDKYKKLTYDLLHNETYERLLKHPHLFRLEVENELARNNQVFVFVDEIQKVPPILDEVHSLYETYRGRVRFLLTGSSARKLKRSGANLLAGRALSLRLHPLTQEEHTPSVDEIVRLGSLPGVVIGNEAPEQTLRSYVSTYLKEEVQQEALVRKIDSFARFLEVSAQYHAEVINATNIAEHAGVSSQTVAEYISILEDTLLAWRLPGWSASTSKQLRKTPKLYLFDNGVASALRGEVGIEVIESSSRFGKMFEAYVIQEFFRMNDYYHLDFKFSYWRTNNDIEVDLIISRGAGRPLAAIEIKSTTAPELKHLSSLKRFSEDYPKVPLFCICRTPKPFVLDKISIIPFNQIHALIDSLL